MMNQIQHKSPESPNDLNCFALYAAARIVVQSYRPFLDELGLTYPQYLVLQALRESAGMTVTQVADQLFLDAGTVTPILKRLQTRGLILRERSKRDERAVINHLTNAGRVLSHQADAVSGIALNRGRMRQELVAPLVEEAQALLAHLTESSS